jgi:phosphotransferase family enzyme
VQDFAGVEPLAVGMEGAVYRLGDGRVAKVWSRRTTAELVRLKAFYDELELPFGTPRFEEIREVDGSAVTIERELAGGPPSSVEPLLAVLEGLAAAPGGSALRELPVLDEPGAAWAGSWPATLAGLIERRVARFGDQLRAAVPGFDALLRRLVARIGELPHEARVVHGDIVPANILVEPLALLDFGFLSMAGDPAFDAAVAAGIWDMYGPGARSMEAEIDRAVVARFGYEAERLALYRAVYAVVTSNAYDVDGRDGHFAWCAELLRTRTSGL